MVQPDLGSKLLFPLAVILMMTTIESTLAQTRDDCLACHEDHELTMEKRGREISIHVDATELASSTHKKLSCVACHVGFDPDDLPHRDPIREVRCTSCHKNVELSHKFHATPLRASKEDGTLNDDCKSCHGQHDVKSSSDPASPIHAANLGTTCAECHEDVAEAFMHSAHGQALAEGLETAPTCIVCHSQPISDSEGNISELHLKQHQTELCLSCHLDDPDVYGMISKSQSFIDVYESSVHGRALLNGNAEAANCVDCHGSHDMHGCFNPDSQINKSHLAEDCGKCHSDVAAEYEESIHGVAVASGNTDAPSCNDCHGEHNILHVHDPHAPVAGSNLSQTICTPCHNSLPLSARYGTSTNRSSTFEDSYHGLALRGGSAEAANCASCHGYHGIKPSSDPTSMIHKDNLAKTCGTCHPGAGERFAQGKVHVTYAKDEEPLLYWLKTIYLIMIFVVIGGMFLHNFLDWRKKAIHRLKVRRGHYPLEEPRQHRLYLRMTVNERIQHLSLMLSFFTLVITGFMLSFPDAWWVVLIRDLSYGVFDIRSLIHRIAGVVIAVVSFYHIYYVTFTKRGRELISDLFPRISDAKEIVISLKYLVGLSKERPRFGRFSYIEKSEYWALIWGNIVMISTGLIMWFNSFFMNLFGKLGWDIARTVHYYEAWLAFLAIVVWHIYFVIFNPEAYPMNLAWIKGTLSEEEMEDEHPRELEKLRDSEYEIVELDEKD